MHHRRTTAIALTGILLATVLVVFAPSASAAPNPWDPAQEELWRQVSPGGYSAAYTCGPCPSQGTVGSATLTPGDYYMLVNGGCNSCSGPFSMSYNIFVVGGLGGTPAISSVNPAISNPVILESGGCNSTCYAYVSFTVTSTITISYSGYHPFGMSNCGFGCSYGGGTISGATTSGFGWVGGFWTGYSGANNYHTVWFSAQSTQSEQGILSTQTQKTPANTKFTWTRINQAQDLVNVDGTTSATPAAIEMAQSFTPNVALGKYLEISASRMSFGGTGCTGKVSISISTDLASPWNTASERANVTADFTHNTATTEAIITTDWLNGVISSDQTSFVLGSTFTRSVAGNTVTDLSAFTPLINGSTLYYRVVYWNTNCDTSKAIPMTAATANTITGGTLWSNSGSGWTETASQDAKGIVLKVYGGNYIEFRLNATQRDTGGAYYTYLGEHQMDSQPQKSYPVSSWGGFPLYGNTLFSLGGGAGSPECSFGGISTKACTLSEMRLGFIPLSLNTTATFTVTLDTSASGRNLFYTGTLTNQPATRTHIKSVTFDNQAGTNPDLVSYTLYSSDDYQYKVTVTVVKCTGLDGSGLCASDNGETIPSGSYFGLIRGLRSLSGTWAANGQFNFSGQDVGGGTTTLSLSKTGYITESGVTVNIPSTPGNYFVTVRLTSGDGLNLTANLAGVSVTFDPASGCYVTGQSLGMNITRSKPVEMWVGLYKLDSIGNPQRITTLYDWTTQVNSTLNYTYPDGRTFSVSDTGKYVLAVSIATSGNTTGKTVNYAKVAVNDACDFPLGVSFLTALNEVAQTEIQTSAVVSGTTVAQKEATTYENYLSFLNWGFAADLFGVPNMVLWLAAFLAFAMVLRFGGGLGRNKEE